MEVEKSNIKEKMDTQTDKLERLLARYSKAGTLWEGEGFCRARHQREKNDYCNRVVIKGSSLCCEHTCIIQGCVREAVCWYPLLPGEPHFCSEHHTPKHAGRYGCDFSGPDDFDIPWG